MYTLKQLFAAIRDPHRILRECNRLYHMKTNTNIHNNGIEIFDEDWDNLIILDACRYDYFDEYADLPGETKYKLSRAASTQEFIRENFTDKNLYDTVYISGNGHYFRLKDRINADLHGEFNLTNPEEKEYLPAEQQYDTSDYGKSKAITEFTKECADRFPNKRLLVHFIPPHHPFRGPTAKRVFEGVGTESQPSQLYELIRTGKVEISDETLRTMYREELEAVIPCVRELIDVLSGKTVVSADHGELLGDRCHPIPHKGYGHHLGLYVDELIKVPWHVCHDGERKKIVSERPSAKDQDAPAEKDINQHLRELGYEL